MKKLIYTLLSLLLFASCDRDDGAYSGQGSGELQITSSIATRASGTSWAEGDDIGVSMYATTTTSAYGAENTLYTTATSSGNFTSTTPLYFPAAADVDLLAYYPYVSEVDLGAYGLSVGGTQTESEIDLMKATATELQSTSEAVNLTFYHTMSKLQITLSDSETVSASDLVGGTMTLSGAVTEGSYNLHTDVITLSAATDDIEATISAEGVAEMILIPQTLIDALLTFETVAGVIYTTNLSATFASGDQTTYTASMSLMAANLSGAVISPWGEDSDTSDDDMVAGVDSGVSFNSETGDYEIYTAAGFASINDLISEQGGDINITLTKDIDLSSVCGEGVNWTPISGFTGTFDGAGHSITGLYIDAESSYEQGLFGSILWSSGTISNVTIVEPIVKGSDSVGALAGCIYGYWDDGTTIENCAVVGGEISGSWATGGLIGMCRESVDIINCYNTATINSTYAAGGLIGTCEMYNGSMTSCYNTGDVIGTSCVGGLFGEGMMIFNTSITACYNTGGVSGTGGVGGLFGVGMMMMNTSITACYSSGSVNSTEADPSDIGGIAGFAYTDEITFTSNYFVDDATDDATYGIGSEGAENENAAALANIAALNTLVPTLNEAITTFDSTVAYEYQAGGDNDTLPTIVAKSVTD